MNVTLEPLLLERTRRTVVQEGITIDVLINLALREYLDQWETRPLPFPRRLGTWLAKQRPPQDLLADVHLAKRKAHQLMEDNQDWIDAATQGGVAHRFARGEVRSK